MVCTAALCKFQALWSLAAMSWKWPNNGSRMNREVHVRFWESPEVKVLRATRQTKGRARGAPFAFLTPLPMWVPPLRVKDRAHGRQHDYWRRPSRYAYWCSSRRRRGQPAFIRRQAVISILNEAVVETPRRGDRGDNSRIWVK